MSFTCPVCRRTSYSDEDEKWGYCGACHDFTGGYGYGYQRHRSSSFTAGQERKMRMPTNDKDGKAQPEVSKVQREGDCDGLLQLRRERMEPGNQPLMRTLQRIGFYNDLTTKSFENMRRLATHERWLFLSVGLTCGVAGTNMLHVLMKSHHVLLLTTGIVILLATCQVVYSYKAMKWQKARKRELDAQTESFKERYGLTDEE
jgi:hypothetical protein